MNRESLTIIVLEDGTSSGNTPASVRFQRALDTAVSAAGEEHVTILRGAETAREALVAQSDDPVHTRSILFAISLPADGINDELSRFLRTLRNTPDILGHTTGAILVDGEGALFTKSTAAQFVYAANNAGCAFIGRPLVEATGDLSNFHIIADNLGTDLEGAYLESVRDLVGRLPDSQSRKPCGVRPPETSPRLLALHASSRETSNTLALWHAVRDRLTGIETREISLRNGTLSDCVGCPFELCLHYGEQDSCFYGGVMVEEVYPALRDADALLMVCPNYNDALGANLTAFINRLTAMYRAHPFTDKALFAIVVSGYSGSDMLASQLIAALNMNKSFYLPPRFCMTATAHEPGSAMRIPGIETQIDSFATAIRNVLG